MIEIANLALLLLAAAMTVPVLFLALQLSAALLPAKASTRLSAVPYPRVAVVMPAHNEEAIIARTVGTLVAQLSPRGRLLVVADNCTDATAQIAAHAGAEVTTRRDANRIGKGYALDHGVRFLRTDPPEVVIFVDADCDVGQGSLEILAKHCTSTGRAVQSRYSMLPPPLTSSAGNITQFAWVIKTLVRPLGSSRLGLPCQLMGSGMALPFEIACELNLASGHLAEDQKLGAELALIGKPPYFCPQARVFSQFPQGESGKRQQRTRWEHGHLAIIGEFFLPLTGRAISRRDLRLFAFALDLCIPPLSLLVLLLALTEVITLFGFAAMGLATPFIVSSSALGCLAVSIGAAWWRFGQGAVSLRELAAVPAYCLLKIPSFVRFFVKRQIGWIRTER